jgi:hypothetical protein
VSATPPEASEAALARRLAELDDEIDRLLRKIWRVDKGLDPVPDRERELDGLQQRFRELSDEFVSAYRAWQQASRE